MTEEELWSIAEHVEPDVLSDLRLTTQLSFGTADFLQDGRYLHAGKNICDAHLCVESSEQKGTCRNSEIGQNSSCKELL